MSRRSGRALVRAVALVPALYGALAFLAGRRVVVRGPSMAPTLVPGERVIFDRLAYVRSRPRVGDIVLARHPLRPGVTFVKRVSAVPGDARPFPGVAPSAPGVPEESLPLPRPSGRGRHKALEGSGELILAIGEYFLLGDNPASSTDSRELGPFHRRDISARAWIVYWPPERVRVLKHGGAAGS
jgi:signal peptidase I